MSCCVQNNLCDLLNVICTAKGQFYHTKLVYLQLLRSVYV